MSSVRSQDTRWTHKYPLCFCILAMDTWDYVGQWGILMEMELFCVLQGLFACESTVISYKKFNSKIKKSSKNSGLLKNIIQTHLADTSDWWLSAFCLCLQSYLWFLASDSALHLRICHIGSYMSRTASNWVVPASKIPLLFWSCCKVVLFLKGAS